MLDKHIRYEHDLEVIWLLYFLIETNSIQIDDSLIHQIVDSKNEIAHIMLLRNELLGEDKIAQIISSAFSWILIYELYVSEHITEELKLKLNLNKNLQMYKYLKQNNVHFCE